MRLWAPATLHFCKSATLGLCSHATVRLCVLARMRLCAYVAMGLCDARSNGVQAGSSDVHARCNGVHVHAGSNHWKFLWAMMVEIPIAISFNFMSSDSIEESWPRTPCNDFLHGLVLLCGDAIVRLCLSATIPRCTSATLRLSACAAVHLCDCRTTRLCDHATLRRSDSATIQSMPNTFRACRPHSEHAEHIQSMPSTFRACRTH